MKYQKRHVMRFIIFSAIFFAIFVASVVLHESIHIAQCMADGGYYGGLGFSMNATYSDPRLSFLGPAPGVYVFCMFDTNEKIAHHNLGLFDREIVAWAAQIVFLAIMIFYAFGHVWDEPKENIRKIDSACVDEYICRGFGEVKK